jgi:hypothetical protein
MWLLPKLGREGVSFAAGDASIDRRPRWSVVVMFEVELKPPTANIFDGGV